MSFEVFVLAQEIPEFRGRIQSIFFLSTPHRGNDHASILNNVPMVSGIFGSRPYLEDLTPGSISLE